MNTKIKTRKTLQVIFSIIVSLIFWSCETQSTNGTCSGTITNAYTGSPISGAEVKLTPHNSPICITDQNGFYYFDNVESGQHTINVSANGYNSATRTVIINDGMNNTFDISIMPKDSGGNDNNDNDDDYDNPGGGGNDYTEDYSEARISTQLENLDVNLISCKREGNNIVLKYTLTNTYQYGNMGITITNVNSFTQKTHIADNFGNQYPNEFVKISLAGNSFGWGNNIEGTLLPNLPTQCIITVQNVDPSATYMHYYMYTSIALPGGVNYSADVILSNIKIH